MENDNSSSTNTVLIVIILLILVGFGVWWFTARKAAVPADSGINVDVNLPSEGDTTPPPSQ